MRKRNKVLLWVLSIIVVVIASAVVLGIYLIKTGAIPDPTALPDGPITNTEPLVQPFEEGSEATNAESMFGTVEATENFSKEQVALAMYDASAYINRAYNDPYLISGQWETAGYPRQYVEDQLSRYFELSTWSEIANNLDVMETNKDDISAQIPAAKSLINQMIFTDFRGQTLQPYALCADNIFESCLEGTVPVMTDWTYTETDDPNVIQVSVTVDSPVVYQKGEVTGVNTYTHKLVFQMVANENADELTDNPSYIISSLAAEYNTSGWQEKVL